VLGGVLPLWFRAFSGLMAPLPTPLSWLLVNQAVPRSYQLALLCAGLVAVPSLVPLFMMNRDHPQSRRDERGRGVRWGHVRRSSLREESFTQFLAWFRSLLRTPFFTFFLVQVLVGLGAGLFIPYFNIYFVQHLGASSALFGLIDGGANALNGLLALAAPWLARRVGRVNSIMVTRLLSIPLLLTIGLTSFLPLAAILYLFRQGLMDMCLGIFQVYSMEVVPQQHRGLANSSYQAGFQVAWAITASLGGLMILQFGYPPLFIAGAALYLLAMAVFWGRFGRKDQRKEEEVSPSGRHQTRPHEDTVISS
jgi:hypothetical protein